MSKINRTRALRNSEKCRTYQKYKNLALDVYRWEGLETLPGKIKGRYIEEMLYECGQCYFTYNENLKEFIVLQNHDTSFINIYGHSDKGRLFSANGTINYEVDYEKDGVKIINNDLKTPTAEYIREYSEKIAEVELAIALNIFQMKFPYMINTNKKSEYSMKNMLQKIMLGEPAVFVSETVSNETVRVMPTGATYLADKLNDYRFELERQILTYLGINNNFEKAERLVVDEVHSNNEFISRSAFLGLKNRQDACDRINKMYGHMGVNISVRLTTDIIKEHVLNQELREQALLKYVTSEAEDIVETEEPEVKQDARPYDEKKSGELYRLLNNVIKNFNLEEIK